MHATQQLEPRRLHHVGGLLGTEPLRPGDVPQQRVEFVHHVVERGQITGAGALQALGEPGRPIGVRDVRLHGHHTPSCRALYAAAARSIAAGGLTSIMLSAPAAAALTPSAWASRPASAAAANDVPLHRANPPSK